MHWMCFEAIFNVYGNVYGVGFANQSVNLTVYKVRNKAKV